MKPIRYGVQIEFTVDNVLDGGPSRHEIRQGLRTAVGQLENLTANARWGSLRDVRIKYLHEATTPKGPRP